MTGGSINTPVPGAPRNPGGPLPLRRLNAVRRTSSYDMNWPEGFGQPMRLEGHARDLLTGAHLDDRTELARSTVTISATTGRQILAIAGPEQGPDLQQFIGARGGGSSRGILAETLAEERARGTLLHLLLDDFAGASLVARWVWSRWADDLDELRAIYAREAVAGKNGRLEGVCTGFRTGTSALLPDGSVDHAIQSFTPVGELVHPEDPAGIHELPVIPGITMRRARWIDVWHETGAVRVAAGFQDSGTTQRGGRAAVHEYRVGMTVDPASWTIATLQAEPRVLPFRECPGAAANVTRLIGGPVASLRQTVVETLPGTDGCTHLNDVLRALADVPALAKLLPEA